MGKRGTQLPMCSPPNQAPPQAESPGTACCLWGWYGVWGCCGHGVRGWGGTVHRGCFGGSGWHPGDRARVSAHGDGRSWTCHRRWWLGTGLGEHICVHGGVHGRVRVRSQERACPSVPKRAQVCPSVRERPCSLLQQRGRAGHGTLDARVPVPEPLGDLEQAVFLPAHPAHASVSPGKSSPLPVSGEPEVLAGCWGDAGVPEYPRCICLLLLLYRG